MTRASWVSTLVAAIFLSALQSCNAACNATAFFEEAVPGLQSCVATYEAACPVTFTCATTGEELIDGTTGFPQFALATFYSGQIPADINSLVSAACDLLVCNQNEIDRVKVFCNQSDSPTAGLLGAATEGDVQAVFDAQAPGASCSFTFPAPTSQPSFQPTREPTNIPTVPPAPTPAPDDNLPLIAGAIGGVAAVGVAAALILRYRRNS